MKPLRDRLTLSGGAIAFLLFVLSLPSPVYGEADAGFIKQVKTKLSYFEKLLHSNSADKLLATDQGATLSKAKVLLIEAQTALEAGDPERADKLVREGFATFTNAVKKIAKKRKAVNATVETRKERYLKLHKTVNDLYLRLNALNKSANTDQQSALDTIARNLSNAEQFAAKGQHYKALDELISAQNLISTVLPNTRKPDPVVAAEPAAKKTSSTPATPPTGKKVAEIKKSAVKPATTTTKPKPAPVAKRPSPPPKKVVKVDTRTTLQKYSAELKRFQRYEALVQPTLEREDIADHEGMQLLKTVDETRLKADQAKGRAIDGNHLSALRLIRAAANELKQALIKAGAKP